MIVDQFIISSKKEKRTDQQERFSRSLLKSVSWRIIGTIDTIIISYLITGKLAFALSIGGIELVTKMILYVAHERVWNKIKWGRK
ncbi:MAG: DUF2061 domain-containing protein [Bacteroidetes bacterium]|nr:DUF2061 domain-containing protein [Bacteroidota bacterium]